MKDTVGVSFSHTHGVCFAIILVITYLFIFRFKSCAFSFFKKIDKSYVMMMKK